VRGGGATPAASAPRALAADPRPPPAAPPRPDAPR
jgi:hypothetical protein